jgi:hypothetical protein
MDVRRERREKEAHHPTLPKQPTVNVKFWLGKIVFASSSFHENTGL